jgi:hypothetical protein
LESLFAALGASGLAINLEKSVFAVPTLDILSQMISAAGLALTAGHTAAINTCPPPHTQDIKQLQRFLGMVNFTVVFFPAAPAFCGLYPIS